MLYHEILKCNNKYYLTGWYLYIELYKNKDNIKNKNTYNWSELSYEPIYNTIMSMVENNFENNMDIIIETIENYLIEEINRTDGYKYINDKLEIEWWILEDMVKCYYCGRIWDGFAQCNCYLDCLDEY